MEYHLISITRKEAYHLGFSSIAKMFESGPFNEVLVLFDGDPYYWRQVQSFPKRQLSSTLPSLVRHNRRSLVLQASDAPRPSLEAILCRMTWGSIPNGENLSLQIDTLKEFHITLLLREELAIPRGAHRCTKRNSSASDT